jgi:hypothetical protein
MRGFRLNIGFLVLDDTFLDKPYVRKMDLVHHMWLGKHHPGVKGIDMLIQLWTDGERHLPCDSRINDKPNEGKTKKDHFGDLIETAKECGFNAEYVPSDGWYSSLVNLKRIDAVGCRWVKCSRTNCRPWPSWFLNAIFSLSDTLSNLQSLDFIVRCAGVQA